MFSVVYWPHYPALAVEKGEKKWDIYNQIIDWLYGV